jgi:hypothetical protein
VVWTRKPSYATSFAEATAVKEASAFVVLLEVGLEGGCFFPGAEGGIVHELPGAVFRGVRRAAFVVLLEAGFEIGSEADVGLVGMSDASQEIDVVH